MKEHWVGKESWKDQQGIVSDGLKIPKYHCFQLGAQLQYFNWEVS